MLEPNSLTHPLTEFLKYGALGFGALLVVLLVCLVVRPMIQSVFAELRATREERTEMASSSRQERREQRQQFIAALDSHSQTHVEAMKEVRQGLREVVDTLRTMNGRDGGA